MTQSYNKVFAGDFSTNDVPTSAAFPSLEQTKTGFQASNYMSDLSRKSLMKNLTYQINKQIEENSNDFKDHMAYLEGITTTLNCETDLQLYKVDKGLSNHVMGLIGMKILSPSLQKLYMNSKYLIRCFQDGQKFFEMPIAEEPLFIDIFENNIIWVLAEKISTLFAIQVKLPGETQSNSYQMSPVQIKQDFLTDPFQLISVKLGHYMTDDQQFQLKAIYLTPTKLFFIPLDFNNTSGSKIEVSHGLFPLQKQNIDPLLKDGWEDKNLNNMLEWVDVDYQDIQVKRFFDYGVLPGLHDGKDDKLWEVVFLQDNFNQLQILQALDCGRTYHKIATIILKNKKLNNQEVNIEVVDGCLLSTSKIITIEKITQIKEHDAQSDSSDNYRLHSLVSQDSISRNVLYRVQVWEINKSQVKKITLFMIPSDVISINFLKNWKQKVLVDYRNNQCYFPEYNSGDVKDQPQKFNQFQITNSKYETFGTLDMTYEASIDLIGSHSDMSTKRSRHKNLQGKLFSDFIAFDRILALAHGRFITIVDILDPIKIKREPQHLCLFDNESADSWNFYDQSYDIDALTIIDRGNSSHDDERAKLIAIFKNQFVGYIFSTVKAFNVDPNQFRLISRPRLLGDERAYSLFPLLDNKNRKVSLPGKLVKIFKNQNQKTIPNFFLVQKDITSERIICFIQHSTLQMREFNIKCSQNDSNYVFFNPTSKNYQKVLVINTKGDEEADAIEQVSFKVKLNIGKQDLPPERQVVQQGNILLPTDMQDIRECVSIFVLKENIYFVYEDVIDNYVLRYNQSESVPSSNYLRTLCISDQTYFYWRQFNKTKDDMMMSGSIYFDKVEQLDEMKDKVLKKQSMIFSGYRPHLHQIQYDTSSNQLSTFTDYNTIKIWPLLNKTSIKIKSAGCQHMDAQTIATRLLGDNLYTLNNNSIINQWHIMTGKLLAQTKISQDFSEFVFHQQINPQLVLLRRVKYSNEEVDDLSVVNLEKAKSKKKTKKDGVDIEKYFDIDSINSGTVKIVTYKIISIEANIPVKLNQNNNDVSPDVSVELLSQGNITEHVTKINLVDANSETQLNKITVNDINVQELSTFEGPYHNEKNNYGFYASIDAELFVFFYRDLKKDLKMHFFNLKLEHTQNVLILKKACPPQTNAHISKFSKDFKYYFQMNPLLGDINLIPYNRFKDQKTSEFQEKLIDNTLKIIKNLDQIGDDQKPCFLNNSEVLFRSQEGLITGYDIFKKQEMFYFMDGYYPGAKKDVKIEGYLQSNGHILAQNSFIFEQFSDPQKENAIELIVAPNNFNKFLNQTHKIQHHQSDDPQDLHYIQKQYKTMIQLQHRSYFGFIYQSSETDEFFNQSSVTKIVSTFNFYQWRTIEMLKNKTLDIDDVSKAALQELCFAQLPNGETLLHKLRMNESAIQAIFEKVYDKDIDNIPFYVPILEDQYGKTVIHYLLKPNKNILQAEDQLAQLYDQKQRETTASIILKQIEDYPFALYNIQFNDIIKEIVQIDDFDFGAFLSSRCKTLSFMQVDQAVCDQNAVRIFSSDNLFTVEQNKVKELLQSDQRYSNDVDIKILDLTEIHYQPKIAKNEITNLDFIYEVLASSKDESIFNNDAIKALIEIRWQVIRLRILLVQFIPYLGMMASFLYYTVHDYQSFLTVHEGDFKMEATVCRAVLLIFTGYFAILTIIQLYTIRMQYIYRRWNYPDLAWMLLIAIAEIVLLYNRKFYGSHQHDISPEERQILDTIDKKIRIMYAFASLCIFTRLLNYFRIFRSTAFFIQILVSIFTNYAMIGNLLFIFILTAIAFSHAFFILFATNLEGPTLTNMSAALQYTWINSFGGNNVSLFSDYQAWVSWFFFIMQELIIYIVLLNCLISIVGLVFGNAQGRHNIIMYTDMLQLMYENKYLLLKKPQNSYKQKFLYLAVPKTDSVDATEMQMEAIEKLLKENQRRQEMQEDKFNTFSTLVLQKLQQISSKN